MKIVAKAVPALQLLSDTNHTVLLLDFHAGMRFASHASDQGMLRGNASLLANAARASHVPLIVSAVASPGFRGEMYPELTTVLDERLVHERQSTNAWEDPAVIASINATGRDRLVVAGLWTSVCVLAPVLSAIDQGFEVYVVTDACGDISADAHERALTRMINAGAYPLTAIQYLFEARRTWPSAGAPMGPEALIRAHRHGRGVEIRGQARPDLQRA
jgi:nicotinamidase-related amidase